MPSFWSIRTRMRCCKRTRWSKNSAALPRIALAAMPGDLPFRFGGQGGRQRLRQAARKQERGLPLPGRLLLRTNRDGIWIPVNLTINRLHVKPKTLALITARDVREQRQAHEQLKAVETELRRVMESVSDCISSAEIDAHRPFPLPLHLPRREEITGQAGGALPARPAALAEGHPSGGSAPVGLHSPSCGQDVQRGKSTAWFGRRQRPLGTRQRARQPERGR